MIDYKTPLQTAEDFLLKGDYGGAWHQALNAAAGAAIAKDLESELAAHQLISQIKGLIGAEVIAASVNLGIAPTRDNIDALVSKHSPHWVRFQKLTEEQLQDLMRAAYQSIAYSKNINSTNYGRRGILPSFEDKYKIFKIIKNNIQKSNF